MIRLDDPIGTDAQRGVVRYQVGSRVYSLDIDAVRQFGATYLLRRCGVEVEADQRRLPVMQRGKRVGTLPASFDPLFARSTTFLYDIRPGDFRRVDETWEAAPGICPGDFEALVGFRR